MLSGAGALTAAAFRATPRRTSLGMPKPPGPAPLLTGGRAKRIPTLPWIPINVHHLETTREVVHAGHWGHAEDSVSRVECARAHLPLPTGGSVVRVPRRLAGG